MKQRGSWYVILLIVILIASLVMLVLENISAITGNVPFTPLTGYLTEGSTWSNVTIESYLAIQMSGNLSAGIDFGTVWTLPTLDQNATKNWCAVNGTCANLSSVNYNQTQYFINVSTDSNTAVTFCLYANEGLKTSGGDVIGLGNETFADNVTITNITSPSMVNNLAMTTSYAQAGLNIPRGNSSYWRFWLDIPAAQASGSYNNTVYFKGITFGNTCTGP